MVSVVPKLVVCNFRVMHFEFRKYLSYSIYFELCDIPKIRVILFLFNIPKPRINLFVIICKLINIYCKEDNYEKIHIGSF